MMIKHKMKKLLISAVLLGCMGAAVISTGCGSTAQQRSSAVSVKTMKVLQQDTIVTHDYSGQVKSMDAVIIKPKVSGSIVEKYFKSGQFVHEGDPLYKIDDRQYDSAVLSARSNVDKARINLNNSMKLIRRSTDQANPKVIFSTTNYHVFRAGLLATGMGLKIEGIGSRTRQYFWINAFVREYIATLYSERKIHIRIILLLLAAVLLLVALLFVAIRYGLVVGI